MSMLLRRVVVVIGVCALGVFGTATASGAAHPHGSSETCAGGPIAPGTYHSLTITGFCSMGAGVFEIKGGLTIAPGGALQATDCASQVIVSGGVSVQRAGLLGLGASSTAHDGSCAADTNDVVRGGLAANEAVAVIIHGTTINGGFSINGGGGFDDCTKNLPGAPFPPFSNVEDSTINGSASVSGLTTCWIGIIRAHVNGGMTVNNNTLGDTDAIEIGLNVIHGGLSCSGNHLDPAVPPDLTTPGAGNGAPTNFFDGVGPNPNTVTGAQTGQCVGL
jgi:hypothetical protein